MIRDFFDEDDLLNEGVFVNFRTKQAIKNNEYYIRLKENSKRMKDKNYSIDERIEFCDQIDRDVTELMKMANKYMVEDSAIKKIRQGITTDLIPEPEIIGIHGIKDAYKQSIASDKNFTVREKFINKLKKLRTEAFLTKSKLLKQRRVIINECSEAYNTICEMDNVIESYEIMSESVLTEGVFDRFKKNVTVQDINKDLKNFIMLFTKNNSRGKYSKVDIIYTTNPLYKYVDGNNRIFICEVKPKRGVKENDIEYNKQCDQLLKEFKSYLHGVNLKGITRIKDEYFIIVPKPTDTKQIKESATDINIADAYSTLFEAAKDMIDTVKDTNEKMMNGNNIVRVTFEGIDLKEADKLLVTLNQMLINEDYDKVKIPMRQYKKGEKLDLQMINRVNKSAEKIIKNGEGLMKKGKMSNDIRSVVKQATKIIHETQNLSKKCIG